MSYVISLSLKVLQGLQMWPWCFKIQWLLRYILAMDRRVFGNKGTFFPSTASARAGGICPERRSMGGLAVVMP